MMRRRDFLEAGGFALLGGLVCGPAWVAALADSLRRSLLVHSLRPENLATPVEWFDRLVTPTDMFFVRCHFGAPAIGLGRPLRVDGLVRRPIELRVSDLEELPQVTLTAVLQCAGNGRALHE